MKYIITLTTEERMKPGNANHLGALIMNPANRHSITIEEYEN